MTTDQAVDSCPFGTFHHVGIVVAQEAHDSTVEGICRLLSGSVTDGGADEALDMRWVFIDSPNNPVIEVASPLLTRPTALTRFLEQRGGGLHHVSFETPDIDASARHADTVWLPRVGVNDNHDGYAEHFIHPRVLGGALFHAFEDRRGS